MNALSYIALFKCDDGNVITRGRRFMINNGLYAYVGSCGNACAARITRHLGKVVNRFWHVDYLHDICSEAAVMILPFRECDVARALLNRYPGVPGFGNSDRRGDVTHLFRVGSVGDDVLKVLRELSAVVREVLGSNHLNTR